MPLYHDEEIIRKVWELKQKHPDWGVRKIGKEVGKSKNKVYRILRRINKGDIKVTKSGKVIDRSKPKGIVALQKAKKPYKTLSRSEKEMPVPKKQGNQVEHAEVPIEPKTPDPLDDLLRGSWEIECDKCGKLFEHKFTNEEINGFKSSGYVYVDCPTCKDYPPGDIVGFFPSNHRVFIRLANVFGAYLRHSRIIKVSAI